MEKRKILDILFWVFLIIGVILLLWRIFGNSPSELAVIMPFVLMLMFKMWSISDGLKDFRYEVRNSFVNVKTDMGEMKKDIDGVKADVDGLKGKLVGRKR